LGSLGIALVIAIIVIFILVVVGWLSFGFNIQVAKGQFPPNNTKAAVQPPAPIPPTVVNTPTPTAPNPNFQYLPQKAYVQAYGPEIGIPSSGGLQPAPTVVVPAQQAAPAANGGFDVGSIMAIVTAAGAGLFAKMKGDQAKKAEAISKDNMGSILDNKEALKELARIMYSMNPEKANQITDAPSVKLETLEKDAADFREKTAKA